MICRYLPVPYEPFADCRYNNYSLSSYFDWLEITIAALLSIMELFMLVDLDRKSTDDLWSLHVEIAQLLKQKIQREKLQLEARLRLLGNRASARRDYPPVLPKYRNPEKPSETWAGRGKQPSWLTAQLKSGKRLGDFRIKKAAGRQTASAS